MAIEPKPAKSSQISRAGAENDKKSSRGSIVAVRQIPPTRYSASAPRTRVDLGCLRCLLGFFRRFCFALVWDFCKIYLGGKETAIRKH